MSAEEAPTGPEPKAVEAADTKKEDAAKPSRTMDELWADTQNEVSVSEVVTQAGAAPAVVPPDSEPLLQPVTESGAQPVADVVSEPVADTVTDTVTETEPVSEPGSHPEEEPLVQPGAASGTQPVAESTSSPPLPDDVFGAEAPLPAFPLLPEEEVDWGEGVELPDVAVKDSSSEPSAPVMEEEMPTDPLLLLDKAALEQMWNGGDETEDELLDTIRALHRGCARPKDLRGYLRVMSQLVRMCLEDMRQLAAPSLDPANEGKISIAASLPKVHENLIHRVVPSLCNFLLYSRPNASAEFALNAFLRLSLDCCMECIRLDIGCFNLLEMIFGFLAKDPKRQEQFYRLCGQSRKSETTKQLEWAPHLYGRGEWRIYKKLKKMRAKAKAADATVDETKEETQGGGDDSSIELEALEKKALGIWEFNGEDDYGDNDTAIGSRPVCMSLSWFQIQNVNYFARIGGFEAIVTRIKSTSSPLDFDALINILRPIAQLRNLFNDDFFADIVDTSVKAVLHWVDSVPDAYAKQMTVDTLTRIQRNVAYMVSSRCETLRCSEWSERILLHYAWRRVRCPFAQQRITGISVINTHCKLAIGKDKWLKDGRRLDELRSVEAKKRKKLEYESTWSSTEWLQSWIEEMGIVEYILDRKLTHVELVRRVLTVISVFVYNGKLDNVRHLKPLWDLAVGSHEAIRHLICGHIKDMVNDLRFSQMRYLFKQIESTPFEMFDSQLIEMVGVLSQAALEKQSLRKSERKHWFGLDLLWRFVQQCNHTAESGGVAGVQALAKTRRKVSHKVAAEALETYLSLLTTEHARSQRERFLHKCIWHIQEAKNVAQNLILLERIVGTFSNLDQSWLKKTMKKVRRSSPDQLRISHEDTQAGVLHKLDKQFALVEHLLQEMDHLKMIADSCREALSLELHQMAINGSAFGYLEELKIRLDFLLFVLMHSDVHLSVVQYKQLWSRLVTGAFSHEEQDLFFLWLLRSTLPPHLSTSSSSTAAAIAPAAAAAGASDSKLRVLDAAVQRTLFEECICKLSTADLSDAGYLCAVSFFCAVNKRIGAVLLKGSKSVLMTPEQRRNRSQLPPHVLAKFPRPTAAIKEGLAKHVRDINSGVSPETYQIDPDDHFIDCKNIRVVDFRNLIGRGYFWDIVLRARESDVGANAIVFLNALHNNFASRLKLKEQESIRSVHVHACLRYLGSVLSKSAPTRTELDNIVIKRMIRMLKQYLEMFSYMKNPKATVGIDVKAVRSFRLPLFTLDMDPNATFAELRSRIYAKLCESTSGLLPKDMVLKWCDNTITAAHDKNRLSFVEWTKSKIVTVERVRYKIPGDVLRSPLWQPLAEGYDYPIKASLPPPAKHMPLTGFVPVPELSFLGKDSSTYDRLFPLLDDPKIGQAVWEVLQLLPPSVAHVKRVLKIAFRDVSQEQWNEIFDVSKPYRLLYHLQILCALMTGEDYRREYFARGHTSDFAYEPHFEWVQRFILIGGFELLASTTLDSGLMEGATSSVDRYAKVKAMCLAFAFKTVSTLLSMDRSFKSVTRAPRECLSDGSLTNTAIFIRVSGDLFQKSLDIIDVILEWSMKAMLRPSGLVTFAAGGGTRGDGLSELLSYEKAFETQRSLEAMQSLRVAEAGAGSLDHRSARVSMLQVDRHDLGPIGGNILVECVFMFVSCARTNPAMVGGFFQKKRLSKFLEKMLLNERNPETKPYIVNALKTFSRIALEPKMLEERVTVGAAFDDDEYRGIVAVDLLKLLLKAMNRSEVQRAQCSEFFELTMHVLDYVCRNLSKEPEVADLLALAAIAAASLLSSVKSDESWTEPTVCNPFLVGLCDLLRVCVSHKLLSAAKTLSLMRTVYEEFLFGVPKGSDTSGEKAKSVLLRSKCFALLLACAECYPECHCATLHKILKDPNWFDQRPRSLEKAIWSFEPADAQRFPMPYVGLSNQGATCYMNSFIQQLFINRQFRRDIMEARLTDEALCKAETGAETKDDEEEDDIDEESLELRTKYRLLDKGSLLYQLQVMFGFLSESDQKYYDTMPLCRVFKTWDGNAVDLKIQQDVNEFCNNLFSQLESELEDTTKKGCINASFQGVLANQMISRDGDCEHLSERDETFHTVSCTVKNKSNLYESLDAYVGGDLLDGDNAYFCERCDTKRATLKRACFKELPKHLVLHLNRFEFDFDTLRKVKLNDCFQFDTEIDLYKYTREGLAQAEAGDSDDIGTAEMEEESKHCSAAAGGGRTTFGGKGTAETSERRADDYYKFVLTGIVVHTGNADAGHYYSYGQSADGDWWEFNDTKIAPFDVSKIGEETFGGTMQVTKKDKSGRQITETVKKPYNAYLLMYTQKKVMKQRRSAAPKKTTTVVSPIISKPMRFSVGRMVATKSMRSLSKLIVLPQMEDIIAQQLVFFNERHVFDFDYTTFLWNLLQIPFVKVLKKRTKLKKSSAIAGAKGAVVLQTAAGIEDCDERLLCSVQITTLFVFEVLVRSKDNASFGQWMKVLYAMYANCELARKWLLARLSTKWQWTVNSLLYNTHLGARHAFVDLILGVLAMQRTKDVAFYAEYCDAIDVLQQWPESTEEMAADHFSVGRFMTQMFRKLATMSEFPNHYAPFMKLLHGFTKLGAAERLLMIRMGALRAIVGFYQNDFQILKFNRQKAGRNDKGQMTYIAIHPKNMADLMECFSALLRSTATPTFPLQSELPSLEIADGTKAEHFADDSQMPDIGAVLQPPFARNNGMLPFALNTEDRMAVFSGLDPLFSEARSGDWTVPKVLDPLPPKTQYDAVMADKRLYLQWKRDRSRRIPEGAKRHLRRLGERMSLLPYRHLRSQCIFEYALMDRTGLDGECPFEEALWQSLVYWCYNNNDLSTAVLTWALKRIREESARRTPRIGAYLRLVEHMFTCGDKFAAKLIEVFIPELAGIILAVSKEGDAASGFVIGQLLTVMQRLALRLPESTAAIAEATDPSKLVAQYRRRWLAARQPLASVSAPISGGSRVSHGV